MIPNRFVYRNNGEIRVYFNYEITMMKTMKVSTASLNQTAGEFEKNIKNIMDAAARRLSAMVPSFLLTPELSLTGYGLEDNFSYYEYYRYRFI